MSGKVPDLSTAQAAAVLADAGLAVQWLCPPTCDWSQHDHGPEEAGKIPVRPGWSSLGYRPTAEVLAEWRDGLNNSILTGFQASAPWSVVVVDLDEEPAVRWAEAHLPPTPLRVRTRRGWHWYYRVNTPTRTRHFKGTDLGLDPTEPCKIDVCGNGGQVVGPYSRHRTGHVYLPADDLRQLRLADLPPFPAELFPAPPELRPADPPPARRFTARDFVESDHRARRYLHSCPASWSGHGGDTQLFDVARYVLRGFPLATRERFVEALSSSDGVEFDLQDSADKALQIILDLWNPRCVAEDGKTSYPWTVERISYKLSEACRSSYPAWFEAFDQEEARAAWEKEHGSTARHMLRQFGVEVAEAAAAASSPPSDDEPPPPPAEPAGEARAPTPPAVVGPSPAPLDGGTGEAFAGAPDAEPASPVRHEPPHPVAAPPPMADGRRWLFKWNPDVGETLRLARAALATLTATLPNGVEVPRFYVKGGSLVELRADCGRVAAHPLSPGQHGDGAAVLEVALSDAKRFKWTKQGGQPSAPPRNLLDTLLRLPAGPGQLPGGGAHPGLPELDLVTEVPVIRRVDHAVVQREGYDPAGRLVYVASPQVPPVNPKPTVKECQEALARLCYLLADFPLPDRALAESVFLALIFTRLVRPSLVRGVCPLFAVTANCVGAGKDKLLAAASLLTDGELPTTRALPTGADREYAWFSMRSLRHVCFNNFPEDQVLRSDQLEAILTSGVFNARVVKTAESGTLDTSDQIFSASGNHLRQSPDMARRSLVIRIIDPTGEPGLRKLREPDLEGYVIRERPKLLHAALTLLVGALRWRGNEAPATYRPIPSFEAWSDVVGRAVVWCGRPGLHHAVGTVYSDDMDARLLALQHLLPLGPFTPSGLLQSLAEPKLGLAGVDWKELRDVLVEQGASLASPAHLGRFLAQLLNRPVAVGGRKLILRRTSSGRTRYEVQEK